MYDAFSEATRAIMSDLLRRCQTLDGTVETYLAQKASKTIRNTAEDAEARRGDRPPIFGVESLANAQY